MVLLAADASAQAADCRRKLRELYETRCHSGCPEGFDAAWKLMAIHLEEGDDAVRSGRWPVALECYQRAGKVIRDRKLGADMEVPAKEWSVRHRLAKQRECRRLEALLAAKPSCAALLLLGFLAAIGRRSRK